MGNNQQGRAARARATAPPPARLASLAGAVDIAGVARDLTRRARPAARAWLRRPDVRVALAATLCMRLFSSLFAAAVPLLSPALYPWQSPFLSDHSHFAHQAAGTRHPVYSLGDYLTQPWNRWDTEWYVDIARHGYVTYGSTAFMPLYPALMRLTAPLFGGSLLGAGLAISTLASSVCFLGLYRLAARLAPGQALGPAVVLICCLLPTSFFLMAAYTEALFLALATFAILASMDCHWWHVALLGVAAALTRQQGVFLAALAVPALLIVLRRGVHVLCADGGDLLAWLRAQRTQAALLAAISLPPLAYIAWLVVLRVGLHSPLPWDVLVSPHPWNLRFGLPWQGLWADFQLLFVPADPVRQHTTMTLNVVLDLTLSLAGVAGLIAGFRRLPLGVMLYLAAIWWSSLTKVQVTGLTVSESRYMLQLVPLCILPAAWLVRGPGWRRLLWVAVCLPLMLLCLWAFTLYIWVA